MLGSAILVLATSTVMGQVEKKQIPEATVKEFGRLVGTWTMIGEEGNDTYKAVYKNEWVTGKYAVRLECEWSGAWEGRGTGFLSWDCVRKELFGPEAYDDGSVIRLRYKILSPGIWVGETANSLAGKGALTAKVRLEFKDEDHYTWTATEATLNGEPQPDMILKFERVK